MIARTLSRAALAGSLLAALGCHKLDIPDGALGCNADDACPAPYVCNPADKKCYRHLPADGGGVDVPRDGGGATDGNGGEASVVITGKVDVGKPCLADDNCQSGFCGDGVCCGERCGDPCKSCAFIYTGLDNGTCGFAKGGSDPHDSCADQTTANKCGENGQCDGKGKCQKAQAGTRCADPACPAAHTFMGAGTCDGNGACTPGMQSDCGTFSCALTGCATPCTRAEDCPAGSYCSSNGTCKTKKTPGDGCGVGGECASGSCSPQGVCCDEACMGACRACTRALTGQPDGTCAPAQQGTDPKDECTADMPSSCGHDGTCDGNGGCRMYDSGTPCASGTCSGSTFTPGKTCNGSGTCASTAAPKDCGQSGCATDGCRTSCAADGDCSATAYCDLLSHTCVGKKGRGAVCVGGNECGLGACIDSVCCDSACQGKCYACSTAKTGAANGICAPVKQGSDPDEECAETTKTTCGLDGTCDGNGQCARWRDGTECAPGSCDANGDYLSPRTCGQGACGASVKDVCGSSVCVAATGCKRMCAQDSDCVGANYCDPASKQCTPQQGLGASCGTNAAACLSGYCVDGLCCQNPCSGACRSCAQADTGQSNGTCADVKGGLDPANECAPGGTTCGLDGTCGGGRCRFTPAGMFCGSPVCNGSTLTPAPTCDGSGACPAATMTGPCPGNLLCAAAATPPACRLTCSTNTDCVSGYYCPGAGSTCAQKIPDGMACSTDGQCVNAHCAGSVCCATACDTTTQTCQTGTCQALRFTLTVSAVSVGGGTGKVTSAAITGGNPAQLDCGTTCSTTVPILTQVMLTATPNPGFYFSSWTGACASNAGPTCLLTVTANTTVSAKFTIANKMFVTSRTYTLSTLGGLVGARNECTTLAQAAGLSGTFIPYLRDPNTNDFVQRINSAPNGKSRGWLRTDGKPFLDEFGDLKIYYSPEVTETGARIAHPISNSAFVYTAVGLPATCTNFEIDAGSPTGGGSAWSFIGGMRCTDPFRVYCFQTDYRAALTFTKATGYYAFLTDNTRAAAVNPAGGLQAADDACNAQASAAGLPGRYRAMLATTTATVASRFTGVAAAQPIVRPDGVMLAARAGDLFATGAGTSRLLSTLTMNAWGDTMERSIVTGVPQMEGNDFNIVGDANSTCSNWSTAASSAIRNGGSPRNSNSFFMTFVEAGSSCDQTVFSDVACLQFMP